MKIQKREHSHANLGQIEIKIDFCVNDLDIYKVILMTSNTLT